MRACSLGLVLSITLTGCSVAPEASAVAPDQPSGTPSPQDAMIVNTAAGRYRVDLDQTLESASLPTNADLKMVDDDLGRYAIKLCSLDFANELRPDRCEVFVQSDRSGLLVGYVTLQQREKLTIDTALQTDRQRTGLGCWITGTLVSTSDQNPGAKLILTADFHARMAYSAWEKSPGDWMVGSGDEGVANVEAAVGMWYFERKNNKLRVNQERWSYCYSDPKIAIDEVFVRAATLTRVGD
jgi:hypothetical protein